MTIPDDISALFSAAAAAIPAAPPAPQFTPYDMGNGFMAQFALTPAQLSLSRIRVMAAAAGQPMMEQDAILATIRNGGTTLTFGLLPTDALAWANDLRSVARGGSGLVIPKG